MIVGDDAAQGGEVLEALRSRLIADEQAGRVRLNSAIRNGDIDYAETILNMIADIPNRRAVLDELAQEMGIEFDGGNS